MSKSSAKTKPGRKTDYPEDSAQSVSVVRDDKGSWRIQHYGGKVAGITIDRPGEASEESTGVGLHDAVMGENTSIREIGQLAGLLGIAEEELALRCGLSRPTLHRRKKAKGRLSWSESDMLSRFASLLRQATEVFEDETAARTWLRTVQIGLGQQVPLDFALSTAGFREVEKLLTRIDHGVYV